jgi:poly-gamma-glutamate capsule biosynthesis protein CapA/YwtB (metallophosphatase superfamily)
MYLPIHSASNGNLLELNLTPFQIRKFRLNRASRQDAAWLRDILVRESGDFGTRVVLNEDNTLTVLWR